MKSCNGCKFANWYKTASGRMHPSGDGRCTYEVKIPPLPASKYWSWNRKGPDINGGHINRREELLDHCVCYANQEVPRG